MESEKNYKDMLQKEECICKDDSSTACSKCENEEKGCEPCNKPNYVFEGQTPEESEKAMEKFYEERKTDKTSKCTKSRIYALKGQTVDQVKELIAKSNKSQSSFKNIENPPGADVEDFLKEDSDFTKSIKDCFKKYDDYRKPNNSSKLSGCDYVMANWRKLAGVNKTEILAKEQNKDLADELMECILNKIKNKFTKLDIRWSDDWERHLNVNNAKTNINLANVARLYENLLYFISKDEAKDIISDIMLKKLSGLFI